MLKVICLVSALLISLCYLSLPSESLSRSQASKCIGGEKANPPVQNACCFRLSECTASDAPCSAHTPEINPGGVCPLVVPAEPSIVSLAKHSAANHTKCQNPGASPGKNCTQSFSAPPQYCAESYACVWDVNVLECVNSGTPLKYEVADNCQSPGCPQP
jgi:hypothetical protein